MVTFFVENQTSKLTNVVLRWQPDHVIIASSFLFPVNKSHYFSYIMQCNHHHFNVLRPFHDTGRPYFVNVHAILTYL